MTTPPDPGRLPDRSPRTPGPLGGRPPGRARDFAAEENRGRQINLALAHIRNGRPADAQHIVDELRAAAPNDAAVHELIGDVAAARGDWKAAMAAFKASLAQEPGRASAETKLARGALQQLDAARLQEFGAAAYAGSPLVARHDAEVGRRRKLSIFASAFIPGAGHFILGQNVKAGIVMGIYFLGTLVLASLPESHAFMQQAAHMMSPSDRAVPEGAQSSGLSIFICIILTIDWLYAVGDTAFSSRSQL